MRAQHNSNLCCCGLYCGAFCEAFADRTRRGRSSDQYGRTPDVSVSSRSRHPLFSPCQSWPVQPCRQCQQLLCLRIERRLLREARDEPPVAHDARLRPHARVVERSAMPLTRKPTVPPGKTDWRAQSVQRRPPRNHHGHFPRFHFVLQYVRIPGTFRGFIFVLQYVRIPRFHNVRIA